MLNHTPLARNPRLENVFSKKSKNVVIKEQDLLKSLPFDVRMSPMSFGVPSGCKDTFQYLFFVDLITGVYPSVNRKKINPAVTVTSVLRNHLKIHQKHTV